MRELADQAFSRAAGAHLIDGNSVELLKDAAENYPAWLEAIASAERYIHFESYIIHEDEQGWKFAEAFIAKAKEGVVVRVLYDWMGGLRRTSQKFWNHLRANGVDVRCYDPPRWYSPLGWLSRNHRKTLTVDGRIGFITGLCVGQMWVGDPPKVEPWRDTGVSMLGPAVADIENAFAHVWSLAGPRIPDEEIAERDSIEKEGDMSIRIVATVPVTAGMMRLDQLVAALARDHLWLTDAYYAGTTSYVQALRAAAMDGVDVRLLLPNSSDIPILRPLSQSGYRPLLEAGVRIFEWNGSMMHAKTAVADGRWSRVGSTNLNIASWFGNCEIDALVEDEGFGRQMTEMFLEDLENSTEVVLDTRKKLSRPGKIKRPRRLATGVSGGRAAAGALRIGNAVGAAFTNRRVLEPVEARLMFIFGTLLLVLAIVFAFFPRVLAYPVVAIFVWIGISLLYRGFKLRSERKRIPDRSSRPGTPV